MKKPFFNITIFTILFCMLAFNPYDWEDRDIENEFLNMANNPYKDYEERRREFYLEQVRAYPQYYGSNVSSQNSDVYDVSDQQTRLYVMGVKPAAKALAYSPSGYTALELIQSGRPRIKRKDGTSFFDGFYQAPNNNFFPININAVRAAKAAGCDENYQGACIPIVDFDLQCSDIPEKNFRVVGVDIHNFDGDHDGIACEPYYP